MMLDMIDAIIYMKLPAKNPQIMIIGIVGANHNYGRNKAKIN